MLSRIAVKRGSRAGQFDALDQPKKSGEPRGNRTKYAREGHRSETNAENEKMEHATGENERRLKDLSKG